MMSRDHRRNVWILMAALFIVSAVLSEIIRPAHDEYQRAALAKSPGDYMDLAGARSPLSGTAFQTLIPTLLGVREVMASLMWVQADHYFHNGEYRPIISMVRQITSIDPHQLDVYATGAWHMAYNFMDKRLIEDGIRFLEEGCANNQSVYDLYFELGYMHYDKTKDFPKAVAAYRQASERGTTGGKTISPSYVRHQLAHAMEKMGDLDQCLRQWEVNVETGRKLLEAGDTDRGPMAINIDAAKHNRYMTARRINERLAAFSERDGDPAQALQLWQDNVQLAQEWLKDAPGHPDVSKDLIVASNQVRRLQAGKVKPVPPADIQLHFTVRRTAPRKLRVEGKIGVLNLSRVHVRFKDKDYESRAKRGFDFRMGECTLEWDNTSIKDGKFVTVIDLDKDPADMERPPSDIYPLKAPDYELSVTYNPRLQAMFIQDRYGWNGEGLTSSPDALREDPTKPGTIKGKQYPLRTVSKSVILKREDILAPGTAVLAKR